MFKKVLKPLTKVQIKNKILKTEQKKFASGEISVLDLPLSSYFSGTPESSLKSVQNELVQEQRTYNHSQLDNGLSIFSNDYNQQGTTVISLAVFAGSRYENYNNSGISHFIQRFFFDSTNTRSKMRLVTEMQKTGGTVSSSNDREHIIYRSESIREAVPKLLTLISDSVLQGRLHEWDLHPIKELVKQDLKDYSESPEILLNEALHATAFNGKNLGNPIICPTHNINNIKIDDIIQRMDSYYNPDRMALFGTNIHHDDLVQLADHFFGSFPEGTGSDEDIPPLEQSEYSGGDYQMHQRRFSKHESGTHSVLAFRGVPFYNDDVFALTVLKHILGESKSNNLRNLHSWGTHGLLNNHIVKQIPKSAGVINEASAFSINYSDDGLFGVKFAGDSSAVGEAVFRSLDLLKTIADKGVCEENLDRGIFKALFKYHSSLETSVGVHEANMSFPTLNVTDIGGFIGSVTAEDVQRVAKNLLLSKPTLVSYGELANVPRLYDLTKSK